MKKWAVEIGNINYHHTYGVYAKTAKEAAAKAKARHKELGRKITEDDGVYVTRRL